MIALFLVTGILARQASVEVSAAGVVILALPDVQVVELAVPDPQIIALSIPDVQVIELAVPL